MKKVLNSSVVLLMISSVFAFTPAPAHAGCDQAYANYLSGRHARTAAVSESAQASLAAAAGTAGMVATGMEDAAVASGAVGAAASAGAGALVGMIYIDAIRNADKGRVEEARWLLLEANGYRDREGHLKGIRGIPLSIEVPKGTYRGFNDSIDPVQPDATTLGRPKDLDALVRDDLISRKDFPASIRAQLNQSDKIAAKAAFSALRE